ncbi:MAG: OmpA family protein [Candidatus Desulfatibia sp.]|uniref:OmpA/MotB family protein n=1 Tax=Candidatus Desulfatibia sp. TaxID=3101189 RepID=UPI002F2C5373
MAAKKRKIDDESKSNIGVTMMVSLFLILLTFFILLNSIAVMDESRTRRAIGSLMGAFGGLPGGLSPLATGDDIMPPSAPLMEADLTLAQLMALMNKPVPVAAGEIRVHEIEEGESVSINAKDLFTKDGAGINPILRPFLSKLGRIIKKGDFPVEIIGHTDAGASQEKGYTSNWELSALSALRVLKYFVSESKIAPRRFTASGQSSHHPIAPNETIRSRAANRRVEIILRYKAPDYVKRILKKKSSGYFTYKKFDFKIF